MLGFPSKYRLFILAIGASLCFIACKKDKKGTGEIKFAVAEKFTGAPIQGVAGVFSATQLEGGSFNAGFVDLQTGLTNTAGQLQFNQDISKLVEMKTAFSKSGYFSQEIKFDKDDFDGQSNFFAPIDLVEIAQVRVHITSESSNTLDESCAFSLKTGNPLCTCCSAFTRFLNGPFVDSSWVCQLPANQWLRYEYSITRDEIPSFYADSIFLEASDTNFVSLTF
ncbi:MAG: hypothetical protein ACJAY8_000759 [Sphingobacteriales bacterium]|jgi:hypothetical protein